MAEVLVAARSARVRSGGALHRVHRGRTTAHADAPVVRERPDLWEPLVPDFPAPEPAAEPSQAEVRAWARGQGIDVPSRGKLPADLVARYKAGG